MIFADYCENIYSKMTFSIFEAFAPPGRAFGVLVIAVEQVFRLLE